MTSARLFRLAGALAAVCLTLFLAGAAAPPPSGHPHLDSLRLLPPVLVSGEKGWSLAERMKHYNAEAVSVAVFRDGKILWAEAAGLADREEHKPATRETLFQAGSISKPVSAAGILREVEAGRLRLDADVNGYLKSWHLPDSPAAAGKKVTLERLLSHSAGLTVHGFPGYEPGTPVPTVPQILDGVAPANTEAVRIELEPGTKFQYSGGGYTIAQLVMTDAIGRPFPDLLRELVLSPAGMTHSTYEQPLPAPKLSLAAAGYRAGGAPIPGKRHTYPEMAAAGLWTTAEDLCRFAIAVQRSLAGEKGALLAKESARRMTTPVLGDVGLGLFRETHEGEIYFGHNGSDEGFQAILVASRDHGYGAAVMVNSDNGVAIGEEILRGIARESGWKYLAAPVAIVTLPAGDLAPLVGRYRLGGDEAISIAVKDGRLAGRSGAEEFELLPVSRDLFVRRDRALRYEAERPTAGGPVSAIRVLSDRAPRVAKRIGDDVHIPSDDLSAGRVAEAIAGYRKLFAETPTDPGVDEGRLNNLGYHLAMLGDFAKADAILKLNTELYPKSANTWDSLAEIAIARNDPATARAASKKVLEVLPSDTKASPGLKQRLKQVAEKRLKELPAVEKF